MGKAQVVEDMNGFEQGVIVQNVKWGVIAHLAFFGVMAHQDGL